VTGTTPSHRTRRDKWIGYFGMAPKFADLGEGPVATRPCRGASEGSRVSVRVGDVEDHAVDPHQTQPAVKGSGRIGPSQGSNDLCEQLPHRRHTEPTSRCGRRAPDLDETEAPSRASIDPAIPDRSVHVAQSLPRSEADRARVELYMYSLSRQRSQWPAVGRPRNPSRATVRQLVPVSAAPFHIVAAPSHP
jgi:hypothetical protein